MSPTSAYRTLAAGIDAERFAELDARLHLDDARWDGQRAAALLLATAYPALAPRILPAPERVDAPEAVPLSQLQEQFQALAYGDDWGSALRRLAEQHRMRIALRELLPSVLGGAPIEQTAREISELAEATIQCALEEAKTAVFARLGVPRHADGSASELCVLGMGKLGGGELNAGSDVDLVFFYDSDSCRAEGRNGEVTAHQVWTKVVQRLALALEEPTADGLVWRVDLRLRPEGSRGPLVNSLAAAERYYEDFGRLWERTAMLRANPVAGDADFGRQVMAMLAPFIWRRTVDPSIAAGIAKMVRRTQAELSRELDRDLKLGTGGIRTAEMFVQTLQLIWGGREPRVRCRHTIEGVMRLQAAGFVNEREARGLAAAYAALRRCEHAVQSASGVQTHLLPSGEAELERLARSLGFADAASMHADLEQHRQLVSALFDALLPDAAQTSRWQDAIRALEDEEADESAFGKALRAAGMRHSNAQHHGQLVRDLFEISRLPDSLLGVRTRERYPHLPEFLFDALADSADPTQAARFLRSMSLRTRQGAIYARLLSNDQAALRRLVTVFGGSAYVAEAVARKPELLDLILFNTAAVTPASARSEVNEGGIQRERIPLDPKERLLTRLRSSKARVITQVALADLRGELDTPAAQRVLSALADAQLETATRHALGLGADETPQGLCLIAMGSLGARETGYGSDLDVMFVYDGERAEEDPVARYSRAAKRIIQLVSLPHPAGRGYVLDTRLRPSGTQGLLVVSLASFARYHGLAQGDARPALRCAAPWERIALVRARFAAGDPELGARAMRLVEEAAYGRAIQPAEVAREVDRVRRRMQQELARERPGRHDIKLGGGGLLEAQLTTQLLQLRCRQPQVRHSGTRAALDALGESGWLENAAALREAYDFLSSLEQRLRVVHADDTCLIQEDAAGLRPLARRMGLRDSPNDSAASQLMERYRAAANTIHESYHRVVQQGRADGDPRAED